MTHSKGLLGVGVDYRMFGIDQDAALGAQLVQGEVGDDHIPLFFDYHAFHQGEFSVQFQGQGQGQVFQARQAQDRGAFVVALEETGQPHSGHQPPALGSQ